MKRSSEYVILVIVGMFGCSGPGAVGGAEPAAQQRVGLDEELDAGADAPDEPDAPPPAFVPLHVPVELLMEGGPGYMPPDLVLDAANTVIDTTALTIGGASSAFFVQHGGYAILFAAAFTVQAPVKVTGGPPLIIAASEQASIDALIDVSAVGRRPGPGPAAGNPGGGAAGKSVVIRDLRVSSGGGGAGHGSLGAPGGSNTPMAPAGAGGTTYDGGGLGPAGPLVGGSKGGNGGLAGAVLGVGGGGGGALQISSRVAIVVGASGQLKASGGGGAGGGLPPIGGGGGGSGGEILLEAPTLTLAGVITANGGGGGGGGGGDGGGGCTICVGTDGKDGNASMTPAAGGVGGIPQGNPGGAGGIVPLPPATKGAGANSKGGGGGAGVGRIWLRYPAATPPVTTGAVITPAASLDPTLP